MLSNLLQKFKHNYTNIWIWKFCLLKIYLNYRELMTTGCWQQRNDSNSKRKLQEKFSLNSQNFLQLYNIFFLQLTLTELLNPCRPLSRLLELCLMKPFAVLFIGKALGFKKALPLWCLPRVWRLQEVRFFSSSSFYHMANESSTCFFLLSHSKRQKLLFTKHYSPMVSKPFSDWESSGVTSWNSN